MRDIKFRGLCIKTGLWAYGDLIHKALTTENIVAETGIAAHGCYPVKVDPETAGQYTGLRDKNGVEIYEGDIVKTIIDMGDFGEESMSFVAEFNPFLGFEFTEGREAEVIGNIYENPEILEKINGIA